ncbi:hypothetical protein F4802DRAFT_581566 [Xylaria palmicola]|nr:hypothetical protein F4802DRAFT_581566 [Xylaria palmicola]
MGVMPLWLGIRPRLMVYVALLIFIGGTLRFVHDSHRVSLVTNTITLPHAANRKWDQEDPCASVAGLEDVFVIVRTGSNEVQQKLPPLLNTSLPCFKHYGIWSDMEEEFAGHHIANALDEVDSTLLDHHADFEYYRYLQEHGKKMVSSEEVASWADAPNTGFGRDTPAWKLDKWKFLPVASKAYRQHPTSKWYIFIECDTYVFWPSLLAWLSNINASRAYYIGRQMNIADLVFAYGGAGIIISNPAMERLVERHAANLETYDKLTINQWAGDFILSRVMSDADVELSTVWPTLEGDMPSLLDMKTKSVKGDYLWCYYATTYHHMAPEDIYSYYNFDKAWNSTDHILPRHGDIFRQLVIPHIRDRISDWDNLSGDVQSENVSFEECRKICEKTSRCMQFSLAGSTCKTSRGIRLGKQKLQADHSEDKVDSGWITERVESFVKVAEKSCSGQSWIMP